MQLTRPYHPDSIQEWLIFHAGQEIFRPGLERLQPLITPFQQWADEKKIKIVTIGGTNGKGETAHQLAHLLKIHGISYTLWTSPHILSITERFSSQNGDIDPEMLGDIFLKNAHYLKNLSYFEFIFVAFIEYSFKLSPQVIILEVGLGGRFDAANSMNPSLTAITSISRDHQEILGHSYQKILKDKWGITREKVTIMTAFELLYLREMAEIWSKKQNSPWVDLFAQKKLSKQDHFSKRNQVMALALFQKLTGIEARDVNFPPLLARGEWEKWNQHQVKFLGSHNPDGMRKLIQYLNDLNENFDAILISFSKRSYDDLKSMVKSLLTLNQQNILLTEFDHPKSANVSRLKEEFDQLKFVDWKQYLQRLSDKKNSSQKILVTGSYYFVGEVKKQLR